MYKDKNQLKNIMLYLCINYNYKDDLSKARLTKMIYLVDWYSALIIRQQLTNIKWTFEHFGPYSFDVIDLARSDDDFIVSIQNNYFGSNKEVIGINLKNLNIINNPNFDDSIITILEFVISNTSNLNWNEFIKFVYNTYPIQKQERYTHLNLIELAKEYNLILESEKSFIS